MEMPAANDGLSVLMTKRRDHLYARRLAQSLRRVLWLLRHKHKLPAVFVDTYGFLYIKTDLLGD
jgi:hypothetical protein